MTSVLTRRPRGERQTQMGKNPESGALRPPPGAGGGRKDPRPRRSLRRESGLPTPGSGPLASGTVRA